MAFHVNSLAATHPAMFRSGNGAIGLWMICGSWRAEHARDVDSGSGEAYPRWFIPSPTARLLGNARQIDRLIESGLWSEALWHEQPGYRMEYEGHLWRITLRKWRARIPATVRRFVMQRDQNTCTECSSRADLTLDHIVPWSKGGPDTTQNLRVLCRSCNSKKGARV